MKILLLTENLGAGGMQRRMIELIKGLGNFSDVELFVVIFSENIHYKEIYDLGVPIKILKRVPKKNPIVFYRLFKFCRRWKPDLIHSWGSMPPILAIPSSLLLRIKLINGNVVDAPKNMRFFDKRLFRARLSYPFSKVIVGNSWAGLKAYHVPINKARCIYNGFDTNRLSNLEDKTLMRKKFNINTNKVIGMVASFSETKDIETYIKAALLLFNQRKDVTFMAVGEGPYLTKYKAMVPNSYISNIIFTGIQKDVESIINLFDIGVLSTNSKVHGEGISNAILEYMALEKPVIATSGGGTNEIVENLKTGILIPPDSPEIMATKMNYLIDNPDVALKMGIAGKKRINKMFSLVEMTNSYYSLYRGLLD